MVATAVDHAGEWAKALVTRESRGPGDMEGAMRRVATRYGLPWRTLWALRYRPPKDIAASIYLTLQDAYRRECERQFKALQHELGLTETTNEAAAALARAAARMGGAEGVK